MNTLRITLAALAFVATGLAQAQEISERSAPMSMKSRVLVAAEARTATPTNEIWDGRDAKAADMARGKSRAEVRAEATAALAMPSKVAMSDSIGGM